MFHVEHPLYEHVRREVAAFEAWGDYIIEKWLDTQRPDPLDQLQEPIEKPRGRRIRDKQRMKARARWVADIIWQKPIGSLQACEKNGDHLQVCSCWMCGHQRKWHGPNMQELRGLQRTDDMMRRSPHLNGPLRINPGMQINRQLRQRIQELLRNRAK